MTCLGRSLVVEDWASGLSDGGPIRWTLSTLFGVVKFKASGSSFSQIDFRSQTRMLSRRPTMRSLFLRDLFSRSSTLSRSHSVSFNAFWQDSWELARSSPKEAILCSASSNRPPCDVISDCNCFKADEMVDERVAVISGDTIANFYLKLPRGCLFFVFCLWPLLNR